MANIYRAYRGMLNRCYNQNQKSYKDYGGRGIFVCERWIGKEGFKNFLSDVGERPENATLDRKDNQGPYSPENCRWATKDEQANNKRNNRWLTGNGKTQTLAQWARELGCNSAAILYRLNKGMSEQEAVTTPPQERPNSKMSEDDARFIKNNYPVMTSSALAVKLGVSKKTVLNVIHGKTFKDVSA
jgi:predicted transcriptional regulator